jgi:hypothetical protein
MGIRWLASAASAFIVVGCGGTVASPCKLSLVCSDTTPDASDAGSVGVDASVDASVDAADATTGAEADVDTQEAGLPDASVRADGSTPPDAEAGARTDASADAGAEASADADAAADADADAGAEASPCSGTCPANATCQGDTCIAHVGDTTGTSNLTASNPFYAHYLLGQKVVLAYPMTVTKLALYSLQNGPDAVMALYTDSGTGPQALVAATAPAAVVTGWNEIPVTHTASIAAGTYWLMSIYDANAMIGGETGSATVDYIALAFDSAASPPVLPDPWSPAPVTYSGTRIGYYVVGLE